MRAAELLGRPVTDETGQAMGRVHDLRVRVAVDRGDPTAVTGLWIGAVVVGGDGVRARLAHAWGYAEGRADGPAWLRRLLLAGHRSRTVPATEVADWDRGGVLVLRSGSGEPDR